MKAGELMKEDWVKTEGTAHKMTGLQILLMEQNNHEHYNEMNTEPIPLTEKILKANGWTEFYYGHFEDENHRHFHRGSDRRLELNLIKGDKCFCTNFSLGRIDFYHVHELQHALRLCGLTELANNFKIK